VQALCATQEPALRDGGNRLDPDPTRNDSPTGAPRALGARVISFLVSINPARFTVIEDFLVPDGSRAAERVSVQRGPVRDRVWSLIGRRAQSWRVDVDKCSGRGSLFSIWQARCDAVTAHFSSSSLTYLNPYDIPARRQPTLIVLGSNRDSSGPKRRFWKPLHGCGRLPQGARQQQHQQQE
jgi:hypothetical protein